MSLANYKRKCIENYKIANPGKEEQILLDNIKGNVNVNIEEISKKQLQNMLDINAIKNDIIELKNAIDRMQAHNRLDNRLDIARFTTCIHYIQGT